MKLNIDVEEDKEDAEQRVNPGEGEQENAVQPPSNRYERSFKSLAEEEMQ